MNGSVQDGEDEEQRLESLETEANDKVEKYYGEQKRCMKYCCKGTD